MKNGLGPTLRPVIVVIVFILGWTAVSSAQFAMINELYYNTPATDTSCFTEICGEPGSSLDGYELVGYNGSSGSEYATIDLSGYTIPDDGYFVIAQDDGVANYDIIDPLADWQNGPDCVILKYFGTEIESIAYGESDPGCGEYVGWPYPGQSVVHCPDCTVEAEYWWADTLTPGESNMCATPTPPGPTDTPGPSPTQGPTATPTPYQSPTPTPEASDLMINELYYNSPEADEHCFTELCGPAGLSLDGYTLIGISGPTGETYGTIDLSGNQIPADGLFVIAQDDMVANYDIIDEACNWQNGPDCVALQLNGVTVDAIGYGESDPQCGRYGGWPFPGESIVRCPDCEFYAELMITGVLSPGEPNVCVTPTPGQSSPTAVPTEPQTTATPTNTPPPATEPPATSTPTPTPPAGDTPTPTMTAVPCDSLTLEFQYPSDMIHPGDDWFLTLEICNPDAEFTNPLVVMLDVGIGLYWFWPSWIEYPPGFDSSTVTVDTGTSVYTIIPEMTWPETGTSSAPFMFHAALLTSDMTALFSSVATSNFSYGP